MPAMFACPTDALYSFQALGRGFRLEAGSKSRTNLIMKQKSTIKAKGYMKKPVHILENSTLNPLDDLPIDAKHLES